MTHYTSLPFLGVGLAADVAGNLPNYRNFIGTEDCIRCSVK